MMCGSFLRRNVEDFEVVAMIAGLSGIRLSEKFLK